MPKRAREDDSDRSQAQAADTKTDDSIVASSSGHNVATMDDYKQGAYLGEGAGGVVYAAVQRKSGRLVAMKRVKCDDVQNGVRGDTLREIRLLQDLRHPNVLELVDVVLAPSASELWVVYEHMDCDLEQMIDRENGIVLSISHIKQYMLMMLEGLAFLHRRWVLHRDIKPANVMFSNADRRLKLIDFGLARSYGTPDRAMTPDVVTPFYKAPELLFGAMTYSVGIDIWAMACTFGELLLRRHLFRSGPSELEQLRKIFSYLGTPTEEDWPFMSALPKHVTFTSVKPHKWEGWFPSTPADARDLLRSMLVLNPNGRATAEDALKHPFFTNAPPPTPIDMLPLSPKAGGAGTPR